MEQIIACCGIVCTECPAYTATAADDNAMREKVAQEWSKAYKAEIKPEDINCNGCKNENGRKFSFCGICEVRKCANGHSVDNCGLCPDYGCETITKFQKMLPVEVKARLDAIHAEMN